MTTRTKLEIESWEDRSGQPEPNSNSFGFVYFSDGSRVGYAPGADGVGPDGLFQPGTNGNGQYRPVSRRHLVMAAALLREEGVIS